MASTFKALIVEDSPVTLLALQNAIARLGWQTSVAPSAELAIEELKKEKYDAVFAELCIRELGGRSISRWIKNQHITTKVFIITSWIGELDNRILLIDGIHDLIRKPLIFNEIRDRIIKHFG